MIHRDYKLFAPNTYWHAYNRGNRKQDIFLDDADRVFFLRRLKEYLYPVPLRMPLKESPEGHPQGGASIMAESHTPYVRKALPAGSFTLLAYCLMPNHFHFLIKQNTNIPVSKLVGKLCTSYGMYFNKKYGTVGGLFQDQFKAVMVENDSYLQWLSAYIHNNPRVSGLTKDLAGYPWSSYLDYAGLRNGTLCQTEVVLSNFSGVESYRLFVDDAVEKITAMKDIQSSLLD